MLGSLKQRGGTIVVAAIVGAVAAGSPAVASEVVAFAKSAGNATTVNKIGASKTPRAGMLVPLNAKGQFPAAVIPASRQAVGKPGPAGLQGAQGLQGAPGPTGAVGATGAKGATGAPGANGANGIDGAKGDKGDAGTNGTNGADGAKGDKGDTGTNGADGAKGDKGDTGDKGDQGLPGGLVYPAFVDINAIPKANASNKWDAFIVNGSSLNNGYRSSHTNGDQTSYLEWELPLATGTWSMEATYANGDDAGIMTFSLDGADIGSVDAYAPTIELNSRATISSINVGASGMHTLRVRTDAKNAASSNYFGYLVWLRLVKQ